LIEQTNNANPLQASQTEEPEKSNATAAKKPFVEPEVSSPVDVLEATTFFIAVDSGTVGP
jgi:hypothetical protein